MKKIAVLFIVLLYSAHSFAQCVILDIPVGGCSSCRSNMPVFKGLTETLPVFAVFKESNRQDSADIEFVLNLTELRIKYVFNTNAYKKFHTENTDAYWYILDHNGEVVLKDNFKNIGNYPFADTIKKLMSTLPGEKHHMYSFSTSRISIYRPDVEKLQILSKHGSKQLGSISAMNFDYKYLTKALKGEDSIIFAENGAKLNDKIRGFRPGFKWFSVTPGGEYYGLLEYVHPFLLNKDTISYKRDKCLVQYDSIGKIKRVYTIDYGKVTEHDIYTDNFRFIDDHSFITITHDPGNWFGDQLKADPNKKIEFITKYNIDAADGLVKFSNLYPFDLPYGHKKKFFDNGLNTLCFSYPYMSVNYGDQLYDLTTGRSCPIVDMQTYITGIDTTTKGFGTETYTVLTVGSFKKKDEAFAVYMLGRDVYIKTFKDMKETKKIYVGTVLPNNYVHMCFIDPYTEQAYFTFREEINSIALPLSLFGI